jgi:hypothetical protein
VPLSQWMAATLLLASIRGQPPFWAFAVDLFVHLFTCIQQLKYFNSHY